LIELIEECMAPAIPATAEEPQEPVPA